jgi:diguanylate cyclase (GGDEF)-like protein
MPHPAVKAPSRVWHRVLWLVLALWAVAAPAQPLSVLTLTAGPGQHDGWSVARVLPDPEAMLSVAQALRSGASFGPAPMPANLGRRAGAVWIALPLAIPQQGNDHWLLDVDYPSLDHVDAYLVDGQRIERHIELGDHIDMARRVMPTRSHVAPLTLQPGTKRLLLLRVQTTGSMVVPLTLYTPERYQAVEAREQALQGLIAGAGLILLLYSLAQWWVLRDAAFGLYALTLLGTTGFFAALAGTGPQHVWGDNQWLTRNGPPFWILVGVCGAFFFCLRALDVARISPRIAWAVRLCGTLAGVAALVYLAGGLGYQAAQVVGMALGPTPLLLVLPVAYKRMRAGDRAALYMLLGWGFYSIGVLVLVGMLGGWVPVGFWTLHGFQFASLMEMATWMLVLGERVQALRREAVQGQAKHERMQWLANTDALTGLTNRRGLHEQLPALLARSGPRSLLAVFLIDLDGFKAVNDRLGHEAGDALLAAMAQRLRAQVRAADLVCRLGGDEFVVAVPDLADEAQAEPIGRQLLQCAQQPFEAAGQLCRVGLTAGYALAPTDSSTVAGVLKQADAAMYEGKQAGRNCLRRANAAQDELAGA